MINEDTKNSIAKILIEDKSTIRYWLICFLPFYIKDITNKQANSIITGLAYGMIYSNTEDLSFDILKILEKISDQKLYNNLRKLNDNCVENNDPIL